MTRELKEVNQGRKVKLRQMAKRRHECVMRMHWHKVTTMAWCKCVATAMLAYEEVQDIIEDDVLLKTEVVQKPDKCGHKNRIAMEEADPDLRSEKEGTPEAFRAKVDELRRIVWICGSRLACLSVVRSMAHELHEWTT